MGSFISVDGPDGSFGAYLARPAATRAPAVVVLQEIFGVNADLRAFCDELAGRGYLAVSPDLFWRLEPGVDMSDRTEVEWKKGFALYNRFDVDQGVKDISVTITAARALSGCTGSVGVMGFCLGGLMSYLTTVRHGAQASVVYYGGGVEQHLTDASKIHNPLLMHLGENDEYIPPPAREAIVAAMHTVPGAEVFTYAGCRHAFARHGGAHYDAAAATLANARTSEFLDRNLR